MESSRLALDSFLKGMRKPLKEQVVPLAIHAAARQAGAGVMFYLVRKAPLKYSEIAKETEPRSKVSSLQCRRSIAIAAVAFFLVSQWHTFQPSSSDDI
jgi:hypothetical protein